MTTKRKIRTKLVELVELQKELEIMKNDASYKLKCTVENAQYIEFIKSEIRVVVGKANLLRSLL
jgi:hypothetical protein